MSIFLDKYYCEVFQLYNMYGVVPFFSHSGNLTCFSSTNYDACLGLLKIGTVELMPVLAVVLVMVMVKALLEHKTKKIIA